MKYLTDVRHKVRFFFSKKTNALEFINHPNVNMFRAVPKIPDTLESLKIYLTIARYGYIREKSNFVLYCINSVIIGPMSLRKNKQRCSGLRIAWTHGTTQPIF